ncbi:protein eva-1 homolog C-like [Polyodon spathula]|uniref:protein eva-1 homolog C-like n=1 Tax=Polyodon spathula TaxID=7913 RepID=UPI001B7F20A8|nr:protein eva-1 homolog C-like [Polyodon spathula]
MSLVHQEIPANYLYAHFRVCVCVCAQCSAGYLQKILKNHRVHACDGEQLTITCPYKTSVTVLSAFYRRRVPSENLCPTVMNMSEERTDCQSSIAITKVFDECQDQRTCQLSVNSRVFGHDPYPSTSKYLIVSYKCRPENHSSKVACENEKLQLVCKNQTVLAIYSATFGHLHHGNPECPQGNSTGADIECLSPSALKKVSRRCHSKLNCSVSADMHTFGDPCFPGLCSELEEELKVDLPGEDPSRKEIEDYDGDTSSDSSFCRLTRSYRASETAELVDRAEVKEPGVNEIWLHKDSSPYAIHKSKAATK